MWKIFILAFLYIWVDRNINGCMKVLMREELVRKLLAQENLCHELQGKSREIERRDFQQAKNGESMRANE